MKIVTTNKSLLQSSKMRHRYLMLILGVIWFVGLAWSLWPLEHFRYEKGLYPEWDPDVLLYRRWLEQSIDRGYPIATDTYQGFPDGYKIQFPPFYLKILLYSVWLFFTIFPKATFPPEYVAGMLPIIAIATLKILFLWRFWRTTRSLTLCTFIAFAALPGFPNNLTFIFLDIDHHWLETSCIWLIILAAAEYIDSEHPFWKIFAGIITAIFIGSWMGSPLWHAFLAFHVALLWLFADRDSFSKFSELASSAMLIGGGLILIYLYFNPISKNILVIYQFSYLQPILAIAAGLWCQMLSRLAPQTPYGRAVAVGIICLITIFILISAPHFQPLEQAKNFLLRKNFFASTISEMQPFVARQGPATSPANFIKFLTTFGLSLFFFPLLLFPDAKNIFRKGNFVFRDFILIMLLLALYQVRYFRWFAGNAGIFQGVIFYQGFKLIHRATINYPYRNYLLALLMLPLLYIQIATSLDNNWSTVQQSPDFLEALNWLQLKTPQTSGYSQDFPPPEYGVLSFWDKGNFIAFVGRRPAVVANTSVGYRLQAEMLTSESEEEAWKLFKQNRVRYFLIAKDAMSPKHHDYMNTIKHNRLPIDLIDLSETKLPASATWRPYHEAFDCWVRHGMTFIQTGAFPTAPSHFRWVYVSKSLSEFYPVVRILEAVPGARLIGKGDPLSPYEIRLKMNLGVLNVPYIATGTLDVSGHLERIVPYATSYVGGRIKTQKHYEVWFNVQGQLSMATVEVPEDAVLQGKTVVIPPPQVATSPWLFRER